jgi:hypothetical protein
LSAATAQRLGFFRAQSGLRTFTSCLQPVNLHEAIAG